jgi:tripartite-type tricarboxylate transporter receptor subunit TctC
MEFLAQKAGLKLTHVAYKGTGPMTTDLLAGQTQGTFTGVPPLLQHIKSGKLKALAVGSAKRVDALPDVPTVSELGFPGFETSQWYGILVPAKTPAPIVQRLSEAINRALKDPELIERFKHDGSMPAGGTPEEFATFIAKESKTWAEVIKAGGIKPE